MSHTVHQKGLGKWVRDSEAWIATRKLPEVLIMGLTVVLLVLKAIFWFVAVAALVIAGMSWWMKRKKWWEW